VRFNNMSDEHRCPVEPPNRTAYPNGTFFPNVWSLRNLQHRSAGLATGLPVLTRGAGSSVSDGARAAVESESAVEAHQDPSDRVDMLPVVEVADIRPISPCILM
jgi:hypothetical protein